MKSWCLAFLAATFCIVSSAFAESLKVDMRVLILTPKNNTSEYPQLSVAEKILRGFGIPYEVKAIYANNGAKIYNGSLGLENVDGSGKYYSVIVTDRNLFIKGRNNQLTTALTPNQWAELRSYEIKFKARHVSLLTNPSAITGLKLLGAASSANNTVILSEDSRKFDPSLVSNMKAPLVGQVHYPAQINPGINIKPFAYFGNYVSGAMDRAVAGVYYKGTDNREQMHLFYSQGDESVSTYALSSAWVHWMTRGIYLGKRRVYLNVHIDDTFLTSDMHTARVPGSVRKFRMSAFDMEHFANQRVGELLALTKNPEYRIEHAFNGEGIFLNGGMNNDALYLAARKRIKDYYWVSHTYTHQDLNRITYAAADKELKDNITVSKTLMAGAEEFFSPNSMVTPHISGLFNGNALRAMKTNNIFYVVGDTSVKALIPPHPHTAVYTTNATNGEAGVLIMPRNATDIYYQTSLPAEITDLFNDIHTNLFSRKHYVFEDIFKIESDRVVPFLLNYQEGAYMFHQANMRAFNYGGKYDSFISLWIKKVVGDLRAYSNLPILSVKMDDLAKIYKNKFAQNDCGRAGRLFIENDEVKGVQVWAKGRCQAYVTLLNGAASFDTTGVESYGPDKTIEVNFNDASNTEAHYFNIKGMSY